MFTRFHHPLLVLVQIEGRYLDVKLLQKRSWRTVAALLIPLCNSSNPFHMSLVWKWITATNVSASLPIVHEKDVHFAA